MYAHAIEEVIMTGLSTALPPFDPELDADNPYITQIPERFMAHSEDYYISIEEEEAWALWLYTGHA